jgi:ribosomal protein RSM22 (predicted rRNA methylase)
LSREDEKFCYIIISGNSVEQSSGDRIIKRPMKRSGHTIFDVCSENGAERRVLSNKVLGRKYFWGDELEAVR